MRCSMAMRWWSLRENGKSCSNIGTRELRGTLRMGMTLGFGRECIRYWAWRKWNENFDLEISVPQ